MSSSSSVASSRLSSPSSSSSQRDVVEQYLMGQTTSIPSPSFHKLTKINSLPSLPLGTATSIRCSELHVASGRLSSPKEEDVEEAQSELDQACHTNDVELATSCALRGASLNRILPSGDIPLFHAVRGKHFTFVEFLRQQGVDMNMRDKGGRTALYIAAENNDEEGIRRLVQLGAERQLKDYKGQTPLHRAAAAGHTRVVELLLGMGADIDATDKAGWTAASHAKLNNHHQLANRLAKVAQPLSGIRGTNPKYLFLRRSRDVLSAICSETAPDAQ